jgi:hypothetical protein
MLGPPSTPSKQTDQIERTRPALNFRSGFLDSDSTTQTARPPKHPPPQITPPASPLRPARSDPANVLSHLLPEPIIQGGDRNHLEPSSLRRRNGRDLRFVRNDYSADGFEPPPKLLDIFTKVHEALTGRHLSHLTFSLVDEGDVLGWEADRRGCSYCRLEPLC